MELRQLRYFVKVVELGSFSQAGVALGVVTSTLSQQVARLESELSTRLLRRLSTGVLPTEAGLAFLRQAQLTLRHADDAVQAARQARLSGHVSVGLAPSSATMLALPFIRAMQQRYPDIRVRLVESLSGELTSMLNARQLDIAVLFRDQTGGRWSLAPLLMERLFLIGRSGLGGLPRGKRCRLSDVQKLPLILPSTSHGLRAVVDAAFAGARSQPRVVIEIDGLTTLLDAVGAGLGATIQPGAAAARLSADGFRVLEITDRLARRPSLLASLPDDELSPAALAARVTLAHVTRELLSGGAWLGASVHNL